MCSGYPFASLYQALQLQSPTEGLVQATPLQVKIAGKVNLMGTFERMYAIILSE